MILQMQSMKLQVHYVILVGNPNKTVLELEDVLPKSSTSGAARDRMLLKGHGLLSTRTFAQITQTLC